MKCRVTYLTWRATPSKVCYSTQLKTDDQTPKSIVLDDTWSLTTSDMDFSLRSFNKTFTFRCSDEQSLMLWTFELRTLLFFLAWEKLKLFDVDCTKQPFMYTMLLLIFSFLRYPDLLKVGAVCKYWYKVSADNVLWKQREVKEGYAKMLYVLNHINFSNKIALQS